MASPIPLRKLLINAFKDLQTSDGNGTVAEDFASAWSFAPQAEDGRITVITADSPTAKDWMLICVLEGIGVMPNRKTLLITAEEDSSSLGRGLLSMTIRASSLRAGYLEDADWSNISAHIQLIRAADVSVLSKGSSSTTTFITQVQEALRCTGSDILIIDQPVRCFPKLRSEMEIGRTEIPASIVAFGKLQPMQIIVLDAEIPTAAP